MKSSIVNQINTILNLVKKLKRKWEIQSHIQFVVIIVVFAITGSVALYISQPILDLLKIDSYIHNRLLYFIARLIIIFPIYQIVLILVATLLGQFNFFWQFEKKMICRLLNRFKK